MLSETFPPLARLTPMIFSLCPAAVKKIYSTVDLPGQEAGGPRAGVVRPGRGRTVSRRSVAGPSADWIRFPDVRRVQRHGRAAERGEPDGEPEKTERGAAP
ncbi:hypothetical protein GCM10010221_63070 [Streptomyces parvus]|nr:hypothetical protein GCM10010221_63070 [Streptomyces parvus]